MIVVLPHNDQSSDVAGQSMIEAAPGQRIQEDNLGEGLQSSDQKDVDQH